MKCPKCDLKVKGRFCEKCGYEVSPNYESKKRLKRLGCFSLILLAIIFLFVVLSVVAYILGAVICLTSMMTSPTCDEPLIYIGIEGTVGWIEWILNTLS